MTPQRFSQMLTAAKFVSISWKFLVLMKVNRIETDAIIVFSLHAVSYVIRLLFQAMQTKSLGRRT